MKNALTTATAGTALTPAPVVGWQRVVDAYLHSLDADTTRRAYRRHLADAFAFWAVATVDELTGEMLGAYRKALTEAAPQPRRAGQSVPKGKRLSPATVEQKLAAVRSFLLWASVHQAHRLPPELVRRTLKAPKGDAEPDISTLTNREVAAVLAAAPTVRDRAIFAVMIAAGLRAAEVVGLDVGDLREDGEGGAFLRVRGKGNRTRHVPIHDDLAGLLRAYLASTDRDTRDDGPLFLSQSWAHAPARMTTRSINYLVEKVKPAAGLTGKHITPHSFRHSYAMRALRHGGNLVGVSRLLGHRSVSTTQVYTRHLEMAELRELVPALPVVPVVQG